MSDTIDCPWCGHLHDPGDYPDHRDVGDTLECEQCPETIKITGIDWEPTFYTEKTTACTCVVNNTEGCPTHDAAEGET